MNSLNEADLTAYRIKIFTDYPAVLATN